MDIAVALGLLALLLAIGVAFAWQERRRVPEEARIYGVEDSIVWVTEGLTSPVAEQLTTYDVRRILEWSVRYLQDPTVRADPDSPIEFAGDDMGRFIQAQSIEQGHGYEPAQIRQVLDLQASYLAAIGALGDRAADDPGERN